MITIPGGTYSDSPHEYRSSSGAWIPSVTQVLSLAGLSSYEGISESVLEKASARGTAVHEIVWAHIKHGDVDPTWLTEETQPRFAAYLNFINDTGFVPDKDWVEVPMIVTIAGMQVGVTPDSIGARRGWPQIIEVKATAQEQASWAYQTAAQEMAYFGRSRCGAAKRAALMLLPNGKYRLVAHERHDHDSKVFIAALTTIYARLEAGQKLWEMSERR